MLQEMACIIHNDYNYRKILSKMTAPVVSAKKALHQENRFYKSGLKLYASIEQ